MSDDVLKIISADPQFVPSTEAREQATRLLKELLPDGEMCEAKVYDTVTFIDNGENFEAVLCSSCGRRLELEPESDNDPIVEWWRGVTDLLDERVATDIDARMPCCGAIVPITTLTFDWPAGFARFELSIWNPNTGRRLSAEQMARFESVLGCRLNQVWAHY